jgi:hypothetical protein
MSHFSEGDWVDFIHALLPVPRDSEIQLHIDEHCPECLEALAFWERVDGSLAQEWRYEPAEHILRAAERLYAVHKPWRWLKASVRWAELAFNSFQQPSLAFVRGPALSDRHLVYKAEPFIIDVTFSTDPARNSLLIIGQILNSQEPSQGTNEIHVLVLNGEELVAKSVATDNGEFEIRCDAHADLSLFISIRGEREIGLALHESMNREGSIP